MKIKIISLLLVFYVSTWLTPQKAAAQVSVSFQVFYDDLSPYGNWVDNSNYGYVWVPKVSRGFTPYGTNGYWVFTDAGWTWVSNYSWGWAPFHYGRWFYDSYYGWLWVPDNEWGPGWVTWRRSDDYYGWAPIGPGISISIAYSSGYNVPYNQWTFVRNRDFGRTNINNYYINSSNNTTIINNTTVINNTRVDRTRNVSYNAGPDRSDVEKHVGKTFTPVAIRESSRPAQNLSNNQLQIYRPQVQKNISADRKPAPSKVVGWKGNQPTRQQTSQPQRNDRPAQQQPSQPKRNEQPVRQQPSQPQRNDRPAQEQPQQPQRNEQPVRQQPSQPQRNDRPAQEQPQQPKRNEQPVRQQPSQPQRNDRPAQQQPQQPKRNEQPVKQQQPSPQKHTDQPPKKKDSNS